MICERLTNTFSALRRHDQIHVALAITLLDIAEAMPLVRQRRSDLVNRRSMSALTGQLAGLGPHQRPFGGYDVATSQPLNAS
jgi:hypothetical protein